MRKAALGVVLCLGSVWGFAQAVTGIIYEFTGGNVTNGGVVTEGIDGDIEIYPSATDYVESDVRMRVEGGSLSIGNYYSSIGSNNAVIHGHWSTMDRVVFEQVDGDTFDLNYYKLTSNPSEGTGAGVNVVSIIASEDGTTESFRSTLPAENWGDDEVTEVYLGPEFDGIKAFWFESDIDDLKCFGMDTFYINKAPPEPTTESPIIIGSGSVEEAIQEAPAQSAPAPAKPVPGLQFYALVLFSLLLGVLGLKQLRT